MSSLRRSGGSRRRRGGLRGSGLRGGRVGRRAVAVDTATRQSRTRHSPRPRCRRSVAAITTTPWRLFGPWPKGRLVGAASRRSVSVGPVAPAPGRSDRCPVLSLLAGAGARRVSGPPDAGAGEGTRGPNRPKALAVRTPRVKCRASASPEMRRLFQRCQPRGFIKPVVDGANHLFARRQAVREERLQERVTIDMPIRRARPPRSPRLA